MYTHICLYIHIYVAQSRLARAHLPGAPPSYMTVVSDSHYRSTLDAVYVCVVPWSEFPIV